MLISLLGGLATEHQYHLAFSLGLQSSSHVGSPKGIRTSIVDDSISIKAWVTELQDVQLAHNGYLPWQCMQRT